MENVKVLFSVYSHRNAHSSVVGVVNDIIIIKIIKTCRSGGPTSPIKYIKRVTGSLSGPDDECVLNDRTTDRSSGNVAGRSSNWVDKTLGGPEIMTSRPGVFILTLLWTLAPTEQKN